MSDVVHQWSGLLADLPRRAIGLAVWLAAMALLFAVVERWRPVRPQRFWRDDLLADVAYYFLGGLVPVFFMVAAATVLVRVFDAVVPGALTTSIAATPLWLRIAVAVVLGDAAYYWAHRWSHEVPWLWRFHAVHHSPTRLDWLVNTRAHVVDLVFVRTLALVPLVALGLPRASHATIEIGVAAFLTFSTVWAFLIHANVNWRLGWLEHVVVSPAFHHWHHGNDDIAVLNKNYASLLPLFDRLFGTHHLPGDRFPSSYGLLAGATATTPTATMAVAAHAEPR